MPLEEERNIIPIVYEVMLVHILSVERQKGIIAVQRCFVENQKGAIAVQSLWQ